MRYSQLSGESQVVAIVELLIDAEKFNFIGITNYEEAHQNLLKHDEENDFDEDGILISNGGMYARKSTGD